MITGQPMFNPSLASETRQQVWNASFVYLKISYLPALLGITVFHPVSRILIFLFFSIPDQTTTQNFLFSSTNYRLRVSGVRNPGFEIRYAMKTYPGSRGQQSTGSQTPDPDDEHCLPVHTVSCILVGIRLQV